MRCPTFSELPSPSPDKMGWPFDTAANRPCLERGLQLPSTISGGSPWPRVSIVTPSYNQQQFIEGTIRSVLLQDYPNLEYIIIDGGSTDGSLEIIRKYEPWLVYWVSEPDEGQTQAINKGFRKATGEILAWLNSDDTYLSGTIQHAVKVLNDRQKAVVYSRCRMVTPEGDLLATYDPAVPVTLRGLLMPWQGHYANPPQPTVFFRRQVLEQVGLLDETLHYALDYELWLRVVQYFEFSFVDTTWANYVVHPQSKTGQGWVPFVNEMYRAGRHHWHRLDMIDHLICRLIGRRLMISRRYLDRAFDASYEGDWLEARRWLLRAFWVDPSRLFNRGVLSLCRKAWGNYLLAGKAGIDL